MSTLKRKQTESVSPPVTIRSIRRRHFSDIMSLNQSNTTEDSAADAGATVTVTEGQEEPPQFQYGFLGFPQGLPPQCLPQINLRTEAGGDIDLTLAINHLLASPAFTTALAGALVPLLSPGLSASITADVNATVLAAVQSATQPLKDEIKLLTGRVASNERCISQLTTENASLSNRVQELENTVVGLEERLEENFSSLDCGLEELEQYGRRNSLRFHNVTLPATSDSDNAIVALCKDKLDVTITTDDICRSHPIGGPNKFDKYQVICRFRNWKIKNKIFTSKRALKGNDDHIFITEDLTAFRQGVVSEMLKAKRANRLHSFWTNDGRMFMKVTAKGYVHRVESIDHLRNLVPPSDEYMYEKSEDM